MKEIEIGKGRRLREGEELAILSLGHPGNFAASAIRDLKIEGLNIGHYDMRFAKPLDEELLHESLSKYAKIIAVEDGTVTGGFGSAILEFANEHGYKNEIKILGIPDKVIEHASQKQQQQEVGIDANHIADAIREMSKIDVGKLIG